MRISDWSSDVCSSDLTSIEELVEKTDDLFPFAFGQTLEEYFEYPMYGDDSYIANTPAKESQIAGFADLTYSITEQLKVTDGPRYAKTKFSFVTFADGSHNSSRTGGERSTHEKTFTPKLSVSVPAEPNNHTS